MKVGFVGVYRRNLTRVQTRALEQVLTDLTPDQFHHGDIIGMDQGGHGTVRKLLPNCKIHVHPPVRETNMAYCEGDVTHCQLDYTRRDTEILNSIDVLIVCTLDKVPYGSPKSTGPWVMIERANEIDLPVIIIDEHGNITNHTSGNTE